MAGLLNLHFVFQISYVHCLCMLFWMHLLLSHIEVWATVFCLKWSKQMRKNAVPKFFCDISLQILQWENYRNIKKIGNIVIMYTYMEICVYWLKWISKAFNNILKKLVLYLFVFCSVAIVNFLVHYFNLKNHKL